MELEKPGRFRKEVKVERIVLGGDATPREFVDKGAGGTAVDSLAVDLEPRSDLAQSLRTRRGDHAIGIGSDVEQVVGVLTNEIDEGGDEIVGRFPSVVVLLETPRVIEGGAGFPIAFESTGREEVVARKIVIAVAVPDPPGHETVGLKLFNEAPDAQGLRGRERHGRVEPDHAYWSILSEKLAELRQHFFF